METTITNNNSPEIFSPAKKTDKRLQVFCFVLFLQNQKINELSDVNAKRISNEIL